MAFRYRNKYFQDGDAVDPSGWTGNIDGYTQEFNGYLDRDNLPSAGVTTAIIQSNAANHIFSQVLQTSAEVSIETTRWLDDDGTNSFGKIEFTAPTDGFLTVEWSGTFQHPRHPQWPAAKALTPSNAEKLTGSWYLNLKLTVDGIELCQVPKCINTFSKSSEYMVGSIPIAAGVHEIKLLARASVLPNDSDEEGPVINHRAIRTHGVPADNILLKNRELVAVFRKR